MSNSSILIAFVRDRLKHYEDEDLTIAVEALCDSYDELDRSMEAVERAINNMRDGNK